LYPSDTGWEHPIRAGIAGLRHKSRHKSQRHNDRCSLRLSGGTPPHPPSCTRAWRRQKKIKKNEQCSADCSRQANVRTMLLISLACPCYRSRHRYLAPRNHHLCGAESCEFLIRPCRMILGIAQERLRRSDSG